MPPSTPLPMRVAFHALGDPLPSRPFSLAIFPLVRKWPFAMCPRRFAPCLYTPLNGRRRSFALTTTPFVSMLLARLALAPPGESMASFKMQLLISSVLTESAPWPSGSMITSLSALPMPSITFLIARLHTILMTSTVFQRCSAFPGNSRRTLPLRPRASTLAFAGTWTPLQFPCLTKKWSSMYLLLTVGLRSQLMLSMPFRNSTESSFMHRWCFRRAARTLRAWKQCSAASATIPLLSDIHLGPSSQTWNGGQANCEDPVLLALSPSPRILSTSELSPTRVLESASESLSGITGVPGDSSQVGRPSMVIATSVGPKLLASSSSFMPLCSRNTIPLPSRSMGTIKVLSKAGGITGVETQPSMLSSREFILSLPLQDAPNVSTPLMCPLLQTRPMGLPERCIPLDPSCCPLLPSLPNLPTTSSTLTPLQRSPSVESPRYVRSLLPNQLVLLAQTPLLAAPSTPVASQTTYSLAAATSGRLGSELGRFPSPTSLISPLPLPLQPRPYPTNLTPLPSSLRPHCLARDRLRLWLPWSARSPITNGGIFFPLTDEDLCRVFDVIGARWEVSTREGYGFGLLVLHAWCDSRGIPEQLRCPISTLLLLTLISTCAGEYSGSAIRNVVYGVRAWHILHGQPWSVDWNQIEAALQGASKLAPIKSRRPQRSPWTPDIIVRIRAYFDLDDPLDSAVFACITSVFWSASRLGEFTVRSLTDFEPHRHVTTACVRLSAGPAGERVTVFHLPRTKCAPDGEDVYWARQSGPSDPEWAFFNHM
ncbi:hypothetical protein B0H34DRAFT_769023, partial [Crassisporium funariophilum]